ncbi:hypothetical protein AOZ06_07490 [Kibdelosporangium phytohabitans]|uniref:Uncharacterized protein n=1 Tax=Kibdelosporangium phytohabitans TaxID=860235 RepID=A0A0N9HV38_9PSEU|nr:hypothetical protein AOZ06_07490 [Kibdelosporangium phytohabitans]
MLLFGHTHTTRPSNWIDTFSRSFFRRGVDWQRRVRRQVGTDHSTTPEEPTMVIWHATQQPASRTTEQQLGQLAARWTRLFRRAPRSARGPRPSARGSE